MRVVSKSFWRGLLAALLSLASVIALAQGMGYRSLVQLDGGALTLFYPAAGQEIAMKRGPFSLAVIPDGQLAPGNRRLIVISHGSGGSPWVHADLARALVLSGFTVAIPTHRGDNYRDSSEPGPPSWRRRPREVSDAIDLVAAQAPFAAALRLDAVGVFGGSAGGHTALSLAGGVWSDARFRDHCDRHLREDFSSCVGFLTLQRGDLLDGVKRWVARRVIDWRFSDATPQRAEDPRIRAAVAMVPFAADFDPATLAQPRIPLGLVVAEKDVNQIPRFHVQAVRSACGANCELVMDLPDAGHGSMLSPIPPFESGSIEDRLLSDPQGFDRKKEIPELNARIVQFFERHLQ